MFDGGHLVSSAHVAGHLTAHQPIQWRVRWRVEKFWGDDTGARPYEVVQREGNMLMHGGASAMFHRLLGGTSVTPFDSGNAHIGVGNGTAIAAATQTDLQGASKLRKPMDSTYPQHTDGTASGNATAVFRSTFNTTDANFSWDEWGLFNASSGGRMLNRKVEALGVKASAAAWVFTISLSLI
ncbi:hypothetical protein AB0C10_15855 [Microbispora amethystogenes]|uniref:hypothetical protein n=1 Tax=Microbispora amethystogenes TaxID=1427754 RepID=UPI0033F33F65